MSWGSIFFALILVTSFAAFGFSVRRLILFLRLGKPDARWDHLPKRIKDVLTIVLGQSKLLREPLPGLMHFSIFWGFLVITIGTLEMMIQGIYPPFSLDFLGPVYSAILLTQDFFVAFVVLAILYALYRRYVIRPKRLQIGKEAQRDATRILLLIFVLMLSLFTLNGANIAAGVDAHVAAKPISRGVALLFGNLSSGTLAIWAEISWWVHMLTVLGFLNYLPFSKHLHVMTAAPNVFMQTSRPKGALKPLSLEDESVTSFGASKITDFTWKQLLDGYTCTECGRCTAACPANNTGKLLSPRTLITQMRHALMEQGPVLIKQQKGETLTQEEQDLIGKPVIGNWITEQELWACTTCRACVTECPVGIEHIDHIVEMRRNLTLMEGKISAEAQTALRNIENNSNPWGIGADTRADWAKGLDVPVMSQVDGGEVDVLFWVGCSGSFDQRNKKISVALTRIMKNAGIRFGILGTEEKCSGDSPRRLGNEYLAQTLMKENIGTLNKYKFKKVVTACPHCFNTLKNEYPQLGGNYEVIHHSEFMAQLLQEGKLSVKAGHEISKITYHDSCYLGRHNDVYDAPRDVVKSVANGAFVETRRSRDKGFCCGAGGGRMWMEEKEGKRVNVERAEELLETGAKTITTACPFCMTMISDGIQAKAKQEEVRVLDLSELIEQTMEPHSLGSILSF